MNPSYFKSEAGETRIGDSDAWKDLKPPPVVGSKAKPSQVVDSTASRSSREKTTNKMAAPSSEGSTPNLPNAQVKTFFKR